MSRRMVYEENDDDEPAHAFLLNLWDMRIKAIVKIQRTFRQWRQQCVDVGWISQENPYHWIHWRQFRREYGWSTSELYDDYGEVRKRTDGGRPTRRCKPEDDDVPLIRHHRYADAINNYKHLYGKLPLDGDEALIALLQESGGLDMGLIARVLATRWWRMKDRQKKGESATAVKTALGSVMLLHAAVVRDLRTSLNFAHGGQRSHVFNMLGQFNNKAQYMRRQLSLRGARDGMEDVVKDYITSLEDSIRWTYAPPDPPPGLPPAIVEMWTASREAVYHDEQPRVCRLRKFGRRWLKAVQDSTENKAALIRPRSAGTLGLAGPPHIDCSKRSELPTLRPDGNTHGHLQMLLDQQRKQGLEGVRARLLHCKNTAWMGGMDWECIAAYAEGRASVPQTSNEYDNEDLADMMDDLLDPDEEGPNRATMDDLLDEDDMDDVEDDVAGLPSGALKPAPPTQAKSWGRRVLTRPNSGRITTTADLPKPTAPPVDKIRNRRFEVSKYTWEVRRMLEEYGLVKGPRTSCQNVLNTISKHLNRPRVLPPIIDGPMSSSTASAIHRKLNPILSSRTLTAPPIVVRARPNSALLMSELGTRIATNIINEAYQPTIVTAPEDDLLAPKGVGPAYADDPAPEVEPPKRLKPGLEWGELQHGWKAAGLQRHHAQDGALIMLEMELGGFHPEFIMAPDRPPEDNPSPKHNQPSEPKQWTPLPPKQSKEEIAASKARASIKAATTKSRLLSASPDKVLPAECNLDDDELSLASDLLALRKGQWLAVIMADALLAQLPKPKKVSKGVPVRHKRLMQMIEFFREYKSKYSGQRGRELMSFPSKNGIRIQGAKMEKRSKTAQANWISTYRTTMFAWLNRYLTLGVLPDDLDFQAALGGTASDTDTGLTSSIASAVASSNALQQEQELGQAVRASIKDLGLSGGVNSAASSDIKRVKDEDVPGQRSGSIASSGGSMAQTEGGSARSGPIIQAGSSGVTDPMLQHRMVSGLISSNGASPAGSFTESLGKGRLGVQRSRHSLASGAVQPDAGGATLDELMFGFASASTIQTHKELKAMATVIAHPQNQTAAEVVRLMPMATLASHMQNSMSASGGLGGRSRAGRVRNSVDGGQWGPLSMRNSSSQAGEVTLDTQSSSTRFNSVMQHQMSGGLGPVSPGGMRELSRIASQGSFTGTFSAANARRNSISITGAAPPNGVLTSAPLHKLGLKSSMSGSLAKLGTFTSLTKSSPGIADALNGARNSVFASVQLSSSPTAASTGNVSGKRLRRNSFVGESDAGRLSSGTRLSVALTSGIATGGMVQGGERSPNRLTEGLTLRASATGLPVLANMKIGAGSGPLRL